MSNQHATACLAPPLTDELLEEYRTLAEGAEGEVGDAMQQLLACVEAWWEAEESEEKSLGFLAVNGRSIDVVPLSKELVQQLWDSTPWMRELNALSTPKDDGLFDSLQGDLRNAAFHLLWFAKELTLDREPLTQDKLRA